MWIAVTVFNPLICLLALGLLPLGYIQTVPTDLLAQMGQQSLGNWLRIGVSIDAVLVLSGAVLTAYVGVTGLMRRMGLDRCLPQILLKENRRRKTNHWIILTFFAVCVSILFFTGGNVATLAGVYTLSFLAVMALFAVGNMMMKVRRAKLPRETRASVAHGCGGAGGRAAGLGGETLAGPGIREGLLHLSVRRGCRGGCDVPAYPSDAWLPVHRAVHRSEGSGIQPSNP